MSDSSQKTDGACARSSGFCCVLRCLLICATIAFIAYLFLCPNNSTTGRRLWIPVVVEGNGKQSVLGESRQMEFWTPSAKTKDYLHMDSGTVIASEQWEALTDETAVTQFGSMLHSNKDVLGYRRVEVWGQGRTNFKPGWWWTLTVLTNCSAGDLAKTYQSYWKTQQPVFIEVIDNRGND